MEGDLSQTCTARFYHAVVRATHPQTQPAHGRDVKKRLKASRWIDSLPMWALLVRLGFPLPVWRGQKLELGVLNIVAIATQ